MLFFSFPSDDDEPEWESSMTDEELVARQVAERHHERILMTVFVAFVSLGFGIYGGVIYDHHIFVSIMSFIVSAISLYLAIKTGFFTKD